MTQPPTKRSKLAKAGGIAAVAGGLLLKFGAKLLFLVKGLLAFGPAQTALSMVISVGAYALFWGWKFALGFVLLIFVHEIGHVVVLQAQGVKASAPMFIPFLGAFVSIKGEQRSVAQEAASALAGPMFGLAGAFAVYVTARETGSGMLMALAYTGFLLNLFNLLPVLPLDGGRVAGALHPAIWIVGMAGAVALIFFFPSPVAVFILVMGAMETLRRWRERKSGKRNEYFDVPGDVRIQIGATYIFAILVCLWGMNAAYLPSPRAGVSS